MSRIIAVGGLKGGAGKSTLAVNLACQLATSQTVSLIDVDPGVHKRVAGRGQAACEGCAHALGGSAASRSLDTAD